MQKQNIIKAVFFLNIFSMLMHHQNEDSHSLSHSDVAHLGEHRHHDDGSNETEEFLNGFFDFFMDTHVHSAVSGDIVVLKKKDFEQQTNINNDLVKTSFDILGYFFVGYRQHSKLPTYHPLNNYFDSYLSSLDSRAPASC